MNNNNNLNYEGNNLEDYKNEHNENEYKWIIWELYKQLNKWNIGNFIHLLLFSFVKWNWSDLFFTYWEPPTVRINKEIYKIDEFYEGGLIFNEDVLQKCFNFLISKDWEEKKQEYLEEFKRKKFLDTSYSLKWYRFRLNISISEWNFMFVFRALANSIPTIQQLGLPESITKTVEWTSGLILVTWPTWSWKSTTLAALVNHINYTQKKHIITLEDPIEYKFSPQKALIEQKELWKDFNDFWSALKAALRQDPDVILFWEVRDRESAENAITLAETWHLVLSTLHTKSAAQTITRIVDIFPPEQHQQILSQLSTTINSIISQRLSKRKDKEWMVWIYEIMHNTSAIANNIRSNAIKSIPNSMNTGAKHWMITLEKSLINLAQQWIIPAKTALSLANNKDIVEKDIYHIVQTEEDD